MLPRRIKRKLSTELSEHLGLDSIRNCITGGRLWLFSHVERCSDDSMVKKCRELLRGNKERVDLERLCIVI